MHPERMTDAVETERLVLFPYTQESLALFNRDLARFEETYGVQYHGEELDHLLTGFLRKLEREIADDPAHYLFFTEFLIVRKADSHVIGSIDFKYVPRGGVTEVGYGMNPRYEGHGYMTEALRAFLDFGRTLGITRVRADTRPDNVRSQNVLRRCGFRFLREDGNLWWEADLRRNGAEDDAAERSRLIAAAVGYVRDLFAANAGGHDAGHTLRVHRCAAALAAEEPGCDALTAELAALLHDADDHKLFRTEGNANARAFLEREGVAPERIERICEAINAVSFSRNRGRRPETIEGQIVQDADRLDAIGAVGIARCFAYGGEHARPMEESVAHFHEKLLLLKDLMNTPAAKRMAERRHAFLKEFLREYAEETE